jgi:hypothetical protein
VRAGGSGRHANPRARKLAPTCRSFEQRCMRRISPARDIQMDEAERAELLPVMDAAIAAVLAGARSTATTGAWRLPTTTSGGYPDRRRAARHRRGPLNGIMGPMPDPKKRAICREELPGAHDSRPLGAAIRSSASLLAHGDKKYCHNRGTTFAASYRAKAPAAAPRGP